MEKRIKRIYRASSFRMCRSLRRGLPLFILLAFIFSCSGFPLKESRPSGVYHRVKSGETLSAIARAYHTDIQGLAEANNITDPSLIETDSVIFIPNAPAVVDEIEIVARSPEKAEKVTPDHSAGKSLTVKDKASDHPQPEIKVRAEGESAKTPVPGPELREETIHPSSRAKKEIPAVRDSTIVVENGSKPKTPKETAGKEKQDQVRFTRNIFIWPLKGKVVSFFGMQPGGMFFNGIRIAAPADSAVFAAADGTVIHSEFLKYYGETIIIQHKDDYATVYASLGVRAASLKARVNKGDRIGFTVSDASKDKAFFYFEIRHKNKARNPLFFLP
jgi:lipoprotein NlpD